MSTRRIIYAKEICPGSLLHFSYLGARERSFCLRNFSRPGLLQECTQNDCDPLVTNQYILDRASVNIAAERRAVADHKWWHRKIRALNQKHLGRRGDPYATIKLPGFVKTPWRQMPLAPAEWPFPYPEFPILDLDVLQSLPKAQKRCDMERILTSPNSEDYVTWNVLRLLEHRSRGEWWRALIEAARHANPAVSLHPDPLDPPQVTPWLHMPSPSTYLNAIRLQMSLSEDDKLVARAKKAVNVEGNSEIDVCFEGRRYLIFVEAKLYADIRKCTTNDPERDQITRSIDCLLDKVGSRTSYFWMLVKDRDPGHAYHKVIRSYRHDPQLLYNALPHRPERLLDQVLKGIALITWRDLLPFLSSQGFTGVEAEVLREVTRRVS